MSTTRDVPLYWLIVLLVGALVLITLASLSRVAVEPGAPFTAEVPLVEGATIGQTFSIDQAGLTGIQVWAPDSVTTPTLSGRLYLSNGLLLTEAPGMSTADGRVVFRFSPLAGVGAVEQTLLFRITADGERLALATSGTPYASGTALIDETSNPATDLAFTLLYARTWADYLWPVSEMAAGREGVFGWPPMYLLVPYGYLLLMAFAFRMLWARTRCG
jgi:hypothetical protein